MKKIFGTDGARGIVNEDLTCNLALSIGASVARVLKKNKKKEKLRFIIGSDTRISKDMLTLAVATGVTSEGCDVLNVGVLPTPAISYLIGKYEADGGFVISASHNPSEYNGIKVLDERGIKLGDELEEACEDIILNDFKLNSKVNDCGKFEYIKTAKDDYIDHLIETIDEDISSIKILVDTANGAASETAPDLFKKLGANVQFINVEPDGLNINKDAGSTHIEKLQSEVISGGYDVGIAYDGDADRCILVDNTGREIDGDYILAIIGSELKKSGKLKNNTIVGTIMSNLGFMKFCEKNDINFVATKVGDKYVLESMLQNDYILGGEQSGHIIFKEFANTGDGELTSLQILNTITKSGISLSSLANVMKKYPQALVNAKVSKDGKDAYLSDEDIKREVEKYEDALAGDGRIVVRPSGTENLIRVMIEGVDQESIDKMCNDLAKFIEEKLK